MNCSTCTVPGQKAGKHINGLQRYRCPACKRRFIEPRIRPLGSMRVPMEKALLALYLLTEGNSIRSIERVVGLEKKTVTTLMLLAAERADRISKKYIRGLKVKDVQADEIWAFVKMKNKTKLRLRPDDDEVGNVWCFVAIERDTKLVLCWHLGGRTTADAEAFLAKLDYAVAGRFQLSTDGLESYPEALALDWNMGSRVDYAQVIKTYEAAHPQQSPGDERSYSPPRVAEMVKVPRMGDPELMMISTSHVERQNLTMRMMMRRLTRLTNAFSKKRENLEAALALHFGFYNFCRIHKTIRCTPAMEAGITKSVWELKDLLTRAV
jgi:transposase-like protein/IS1 family transposase